jgi:ATP-dependent RNA helicase DDX18/HAS1
LKALVIDEADRILEVGFEEEMKKIISILPNGAPDPALNSSSSVLICTHSSRESTIDALFCNTNK